MYVSLSVTIHLGLEKDSKLVSLGLEHMETMMQRIITHLSVCFSEQVIAFREAFHGTVAISIPDFGP